MTEEKTPETQDTSEEEKQQELLFGKYKSQEEAEAAFKELERKQTEMAEQLDREQRLNALLSTDEKASAQTQEEQRVSYPQLTSVFDEEQAAALEQIIAAREQNITKNLTNQFTKVINNIETQRSVREKFYNSYTDLKGFEFEVDQEAEKLAQELGERIQRVPTESLMKEVARRTKERITENKKRYSRADTLFVQGSQVNEPQAPKKDDEEDSSSAEERTQKYFEDLRKSPQQKPLRG